jgi:Na+(H+)/acetate symporter ActP
MMLLSPAKNTILLWVVSIQVGIQFCSAEKMLQGLVFAFVKSPHYPGVVLSAWNGNTWHRGRKMALS